MNKLKLFFVILVSIFLCLLCVYFSAPKAFDGKTHIKFTSWGSQSEITILKPILAQFEKENPDIKVEFVHIPQNYFQKLHLLFASNLAPDVLFINNLNLPVFANAGVLQELKPVDFNKKDFFEKSIEIMSYNGKIYAIPRDVSNLVIYYNKDIFDKYGVPYPQNDWTMKDFLNIAQKLTKDTNGDGKIDIWGISFEEDLFFYMPYLMSEGGGVLSDDLKQEILSDVKSQKGLKFYADLRGKYHVAPRASESASATMAQLFLQKRLAMQLSGRWLVPKYREDAKFNWDVVNFPSGDKGSIVQADASGFAISKASKYKNADLRLVKYLSSKSASEKFTKSGLIVPARIDTAYGTFLKNGNLPPKNAKIFLDVIKTSKKTPVSVDYNEIQDKTKQQNEKMFNL